MATVIQETKKRVKKPEVKNIVKESDEKIAVSLAAIQQKAYELYEKSGYQQGRDEQNWFEAKKILEAGGK